MNTYELLTLLSSLVAVAISATSLVRSRNVATEQARLGTEQLKLAEEQLKLNQKLAEEQSRLNEVTAKLSSYQIKELEEQEQLKRKPAINVRFSKLGKMAELVIANRGQASAYDVDVELVDCKDEDNPLMRTGQLLPHPEIRPTSVLKIPAAFHIGSPLTYQVKVTWKDAGGEQSDTFWVNSNS